MPDTANVPDLKRHMKVIEPSKSSSSVQLVQIERHRLDCGDPKDRQSELRHSPG